MKKKIYNYYRMFLQEWLPGETYPGCIVTCDYWMGKTQKEARESFINQALPFSKGKIKCAAIKR